MKNNEQIEFNLPGLDCGLCGFKTCQEFEGKLAFEPSMIERCIHMSAATLGFRNNLDSCPPLSMVDSLGREYDFLLDHLPEDPGPREIIIPRNPSIIRELDIQKGDILVGRPLGMSCGCPISHCGTVLDVDARNAVITWCITGPLETRQHGYKDLGYYSAEAYEGIVNTTQKNLRLGERYFFQPRMCMLQWRHSGLINSINNSPNGLRIRLEGLFIG